MRSNPQSPIHSSLRLQAVGQSAAKNEFSSVGYPKIYKCVVNTEQEQNNLKSNLSWRQATSMPIIKVVYYSYENSKHSSTTFPKIYNIQLESIVKNINDIKNLQIGQALYLIKQYLLGIQTLSMKFNQEFDAIKGFYGINHKGQAKVWISDNFIKAQNQKNSVVFSFSSNSGYSKLVDVLGFLFSIIEQGLKHTFKPTFKQIQRKLLSTNYVTYSDFHSKLKKLCEQMRIYTPSCLISYNIDSKKYQNKVQTNKKYSQQKKYKNSIPKYHFNNFANIKQQVGSNTFKYIPHNRNEQQFRYNSPPQFQHCSAYTSAKKLDLQACSSNKPKVHWTYTNSANRNQIAFGQFQYKPHTQTIIEQKPIQSFQPYESFNCLPPKKPSKISTVNNSINRKQFYPRKTVTYDEQLYQCRTVPYNKFDRNLNSQNKNINVPQYFQNTRDQITIQQFNPLAEQDNPIQKLKLNSVKSFNPKIVEQSFIHGLQNKSEETSKVTMNSSSLVLDPLNICKESLATTQFSHNTDRGIKNSLQQFHQKCVKTKLIDMIDNDKPVVNSIMFTTPAQSRRNVQASKTTYNFGGLIPLDMIKVVRESQEISGKQVQSLSASREQDQNISQNYEVNISPQKNILFKKQEMQTKQKFQIDFDVLCGVNIMAKFFNEDFKDLKQSVWCGQQKKAEHLHIKLQKLGKFGRQIKQSYVPE